MFRFLSYYMYALKYSLALALALALTPISAAGG